MFQAVGICKKYFYYLEKLGPSHQHHLIIFHSFLCFTVLTSKKSSLSLICIIFSTQTHYYLKYNLVYKAY